MGNKAIMLAIIGLVLYAIVAWIVAIKVIIDFLFMLAGWVVAR